MVAVPAAAAASLAALSPHVAAAVAAAVAAGASRHVVAATAAAVTRVVLAGTTDAAGEPPDQAVCEEVEARVGAMRPVLKEKVMAAVEGRPEAVPGAARLLRNIAAHAGFGEGGEVLQATTAELRKRQRGRKKASAPAPAPPAAASSPSGSEPERVGGTPAQIEHQEGFDSETTEQSEASHGTEVGSLSVLSTDVHPDVHEAWMTIASRLSDSSIAMLVKQGYFFDDAGKYLKVLG